jgi:hypothetical protein
MDDRQKYESPTNSVESISIDDGQLWNRRGKHLPLSLLAIRRHPTSSVPTEGMDEPVAGCSVMIRAQMLAVAKDRAPNCLNEERLPLEHAGETTLRIAADRIGWIAVLVYRPFAPDGCLPKKLPLQKVLEMKFKRLSTALFPISPSQIGS